MDIKDLVLSSLEELENGVLKEIAKDSDNKKEKEVEKKQEVKREIEKNSKIEIEEDIKITKDGKSIELKEKIIENDKGELEIESSSFKFNDDNEYKDFLLNLRERLLVLFEGLKSSNNKKVEAKVDLVLNFFEYLLATIEDKLEKK